MAYHRKKDIFGLFNKTKTSRYRLGGKSRGGGGFSFGSGFGLSPETKKGVFIILIFVFGILALLGLFDLSGDFGKVIGKILALIFGSVKWLVPVFLFLWSYVLLRDDKYKIKVINYLGVGLLIAGLAGLLHLRYEPVLAMSYAQEGIGGGYLGAGVSLLLIKFTGFWGSLVIGLAIFAIGLLLTFETSIYGLMWPLHLFRFIKEKFGAWASQMPKLKAKEPRVPAAEDDYEEEIAEPETAAPVAANAEEAEPVPSFTKSAISKGESEAKAEPAAGIKLPKKFGRRIELPINLLNCKTGKASSGDIKNNQEIIRKTLANFGINVEMSDVNVGPTVTQYTFRPADGVKLSRIVNLNSDLALSLAAHPVRIEAPIPGKSLVGIEIPNQASAKVTMGEILMSKEFKARPNNLCIALGKDVSGKACFAQLDKMPHLLIAGATGSGKSVCINSVIVSLLYQNSPDELKFILVDPKRVELPLYNNLPYLLTPVITDVKKTINALKWCIVEMERRFEVLSKKGKRNIASYNESASEKLPYIIFIIDELADLMALSGNDMEAGVVRLAQMARAVGIHLILATQRPSIEVITGLIKANIPGRIAFSVASLIDSRTILDASGAEKLVGRGDMLYVGPEYSKPKRIQGVYLSDSEISQVVNYIKDQGEANYIEELNGQTSLGGIAGSSGFSDDDDPLMPEVIEVIRQTGKASASLLQRRLKLGYARAARILDLLEDKGIIGPADGAKPREVFLEKLGGVGAVEFAAREHGLEGELRPMSEDDEEEEVSLNEEEPGFTAFSRSKSAEEKTDNEEIEEVEPEEPHQIEDDAKETMEEEKREIIEEAANEEAEQAEESEEEEEKEEEEEDVPAFSGKKISPAVKKTAGKKDYFSEDEWT